MFTFSKQFKYQNLGLATLKCLQKYTNAIFGDQFHQQCILKMSKKESAVSSQISSRAVLFTSKNLGYTLTISKMLYH